MHKEKILVDKTRDSSYWKMSAAIDAYHEANMSLLAVDLLQSYGERWPVRIYQRPCRKQVYPWWENIAVYRV